MRPKKWKKLKQRELVKKNVVEDVKPVEESVEHPSAPQKDLKPPTLLEVEPVEPVEPVEEHPSAPQKDLKPSTLLEVEPVKRKLLRAPWRTTILEDGTKI